MLAKTKEKLQRTFKIKTIFQKHYEFLELKPNVTYRYFTLAEFKMI